MALICTGYNCPKSKKCGRCVDNLSSKYYIDINTTKELGDPNGNCAWFELVDNWSEIKLRKALELAVNDRNYLAEQIYLGAVDSGKLSVDYYIEQAERRLNDEETT